MPVVTDVPVQDSTNPQYRQAGGTNFGELNPFYFHIGSSLYQLLAEVQTGHRIGMFKRAVSDVQGSWSDQPNGLDATNAPDIGSQSGNLQVFYDSATGIIAVLYLLTDHVSLKICEFDTNTDTWGTPTAAVTVQDVTRKFGFTRKSDGTYVVIGTRTGHLYYILNTAGTWGSITDTSLAATATVVCGGIIDASDNSFVLLNETGFAMSLRHLDSSETLSTGVTITTSLATAAHRPAFCFYGATGIAVGFSPSSGGNAGDAVVSIAPIATAPVFTDYNVYHTTGPFGNETVSYITPVLALDGTTLNVFFVALDHDIPQDQIMQSAFDGVSTWSAAIVYYDEITNPPVNGLTPPGNSAQFIHTLQAIELTQGWTVATAMETLLDAVQSCTGFFLEPPAAIEQTLQLVVQIVGGTAVPTDSTATAVGPVTISGAGGVGPSDVDVGTYALSATPIANYTASDFVCVGGDQTGNDETINPGDMAVCTVVFILIALGVGCPVISNGTVGIPFTAAIVVTGGVPPYSFAIISGTLGPGLTLDTVTGIIIGTPTASGTFTYTVQVTDSEDTVVTTTCQITIAAHCPIVLPSTDSCGVTLPATDSCPVSLPQDTCTCPD